MNELDYKLLTALADKLGTSIDNLWRALLAQAKVEAAFSLIVMLCSVVVGAWLIKKLLKMKLGENEAGAFYAAGAFVCIVVFFISIYKALTCLFNPEYYALAHILNQLY